MIVGGNGIIQDHTVERILSALQKHRAFRQIGGLRHKQQAQEEREDHGAQAHGCQCGCIGQGGQQRAVLAVAGGQIHQSRMRRIVHRVCDGKPEVIADRDAHQCHALSLRVDGIRRKRRNDEENQKGQERDRNRNQQQRTCLACAGGALVHQTADNNVAKHNKNHGDDRQPLEELACPRVDVQHVGHVLVEIVGQDRVGHQGQGRTDEIADRAFREECHIGFLDQTGQFIKYAAFA